MDLGTYKSVHAEIWFGDRFWGDTKHYAVIFEILIFRDFSGMDGRVGSQIHRILCQN